MSDAIPTATERAPAASNSSLQHGDNTSGNIGLTLIEILHLWLDCKNSFILRARNVAGSGLRRPFLPHAARTRVANRHCHDTVPAVELHLLRHPLGWAGLLYLDGTVVST